MLFRSVWAQMGLGGFGGCPLGASTGSVVSWALRVLRSPGAAAPGAVVVAISSVGGGRPVVGVADRVSVYSGDEDLVDDELAVKGQPVKTAP